MTAKIIYGKRIAEEINKNNAQNLNDLVSKFKIKPNIVTIKIGDDTESNIYLKLRDKACEKAGIISRHLEFPYNISEKEIIKYIKSLNSDINVHGLLIQFPIPTNISSYNLLNTIIPKKDVEGLNPYNLGNTLIGNENLVPCTPLAVLKIIEHEKINLEGKNVVIVNHSNVVGKPLFLLLLNRNSTVTICHIFTKDLKKYTLKADILIAATGKPNLINSEYVKNKSFLIDVGIAKTKHGLCGDIDFESVKEIVDKITPVPGGVGPVTVACSISNMIKTYIYCMRT
jgi:methylenetetrahydrofolate dehydrogenase (NADP+)/methenyltetrahydrofolate cyclohydrolase